MKTTTLRNLSFVVMVLGLLLVLGGVSLFVAANGPRDRAYTFSLPNQANRYQRIQVSILTAGSIDVVYQSDYAIMIWVMTEAQHADFLQTGQAQGLGQDTGISGGFTAALPSGGSYFVEIGHGSGYETTAEAGIVRLSLSGLDPRCSTGDSVVSSAGRSWRSSASSIAAWRRNDRPPCPRSTDPEGSVTLAIRARNTLGPVRPWRHLRASACPRRGRSS